MNRRAIIAVLWFAVAALFVASIVLAAFREQSLSIEVMALDLVVFVACTWFADGVIETEEE